MTKTFTLSYDSGNPLKIEADALILPIRTDESGGLVFAGPAADANTSLKGELRQLAADAHFTGKPGSRLVVPTVGRMKARRVVLTGIGSAEIVDAETLRQAWGVAVTAARDAGAKRLVSALPEGDAAEALLEGAVQGVLLGLYHFQTYYGTVKNEKPLRRIESISFVDKRLDEAAAANALERGRRAGRCRQSGARSDPRARWRADTGECGRVRQGHFQKSRAHL